MAMFKGFRVLEKSKPPTPHSVILEHRHKTEALLFESQAVAVLCKLVLGGGFQNRVNRGSESPCCYVVQFLIIPFPCSRPRDRDNPQAIRESG